LAHGTTGAPRGQSNAGERRQHFTHAAEHGSGIKEVMSTVLARAPATEPKTTVSAVEMGARQREISVSEFFTKNRHLLGFDNPRKALLTCVKEAVDNALDASEEAGILPDVVVNVEVASSSDAAPPPASQATRFRVTVIDNGPGIVRQQIPPIFAKLLYGSKFHRLRMSRGQQGIGISAAGMYAQLTTGKPVQITSRTGARAAAHYFELSIDTKKNEPRIFENKKIDWEHPRGTQVVLEIEGRYQKGRASVDEYLEQVAIANPHVNLVYHTPEGETREYPRTIHELPPQPREIKPHPYGIEFGILLRMLHDTKSHSLAGFLTSDFSRVSSAVAQEICRTAKLSPDTRPRNLHGEDAEALYKAIQTTKIMAPPSNCLSPIGEKAILHGLYKQIKGEFYTAVTRPPAVYRGNPFVIEAGLAYGKAPDQAATPEAPASPLAEGEREKDDSELARVIRYANRVPLLYQQSACATFKAVLDTDWRNYGVTQSRGALPAGPMVVFVHMASVWVPFTSESKEAIADYDEIRREIKLGLQECGRRLGVFLRRRERAKSEFRRRNIFELYIEEVVEACSRLKGGKLPKDKLKSQLQKIAMKRTGGLRTDEILGKNGGGPEGLPHSIIVTPEGTEGEAPELPIAEVSDVGPPEPPGPERESPALPVPAAAKSHARKGNAAKATGGARRAERAGDEKSGRSAGRERKTAPTGRRGRHAPTGRRARR
jgi:DNA topoisomerase VI subunit B